MAQPVLRLSKKACRPFPTTFAARRIALLVRYLRTIRTFTLYKISVSGKAANGYRMRAEKCFLPRTQGELAEGQEKVAWAMSLQKTDFILFRRFTAKLYEFFDRLHRQNAVGVLPVL